MRSVRSGQQIKHHHTQRRYCANINSNTAHSFLYSDTDTLSPKVSEYFTCMDQKFAGDKQIVVITKVLCQLRRPMEPVKVSCCSWCDDQSPHLNWNPHPPKHRLDAVHSTAFVCPLYLCILVLIGCFVVSADPLNGTLCSLFGCCRLLLPMNLFLEHFI